MASSPRCCSRCRAATHSRPNTPSTIRRTSRPPSPRYAAATAGIGHHPPSTCARSWRQDLTWPAIDLTVSATAPLSRRTLAEEAEGLSGAAVARDLRVHRNRPDRDTQNRRDRRHFAYSLRREAPRGQRPDVRLHGGHIEQDDADVRRRSSSSAASENSPCTGAPRWRHGDAGERHGRQAQLALAI